MMTSMMNSTVGAFFALVFLVIFPATAQELSPREIVTKICEMQYQNSVSGDKAPARKSKLWRLVEQHFDREGYVIFVAGQAWKKATPEGQARFSAAVYQTLDEMVSRVADFFISKCVVVSESAKDGKLYVGTRMTERGDEKPQVHNIEFVLEQRGGVWKVADLLVNGSFSQRSAAAEKHRKTLVALLQ